MNTASIDLSQAGDILIVDDTAANRILLTAILLEAGYGVRAAASGELALRNVQDRAPALVLLDVKMLGMDGFEVCRRLKENTLTRDIPVIFLSALTDTAAKLKGFALGAVDYITKPFQSDEVLARVRVHLTLSAAQEQLTNQIHQLTLTDEQMARDIAEHKRLQEKLEAALKRLQTLNIQFTSAQEKERHEIAHELHEQVAQEIVSLAIYLGLLKTQGLGEEAQERLQVAQSISKVMLERIRNISRNLRSPDFDALNILGLSEALRMYCKQRADVSGWKLHFNAAQPEALPREVMLACFRVVQDAFAQIAKHAGATEVWLDLRSASDELRLSLRDNGAGLDATVVHSSADGQSLVLLGMEERVRQVGGSLEVKLQPGGGTEINAVFPCSVPKHLLHDSAAQTDSDRNA